MSFLKRLSVFQMQLVATTGITICGDACAQKLESKETFDRPRTLRFLLVRCTFIVPTVWVFMKYVDKRFVDPSWAVRTMKKVVSDALFLQPFACFGFFTFMSLLEGNSPRKRIESAYIDTVVRGWLFWGPIDVILYGFIPIQYRIPIGQLCAVLWTIYLSSRNEKERAGVKS